MQEPTSRPEPERESGTLPNKFTARDVQDVVSVHNSRLLEVEGIVGELRGTFNNFSADMYGSINDAADVLDQIVKYINDMVTRLQAVLLDAGIELDVDELVLVEPERDYTEDLEEHSEASDVAEEDESVYPEELILDDGGNDDY